jgi:hypothetical protein
MSWSKSNYEDENPFADPNDSESRSYESKVPLTANQFSTGEKPLWLQQDSSPSSNSVPQFSSSSSQRSSKSIDPNAMTAPVKVPEEMDP